jgi:hypothetical protein
VASEAEAAPAAEGETAAVEVPAQAVAAAPGEGKRRRNKRRNKNKRREIKPPERRCQACLDFLGEKKTIEISCEGCKTPIYWPPESQLQTHLGAWAVPTLCGACKRDLTEAQRAAEREALRHPEVPAPEAAAPPVGEPPPEASASETPPS